MNPSLNGTKSNLQILSRDCDFYWPGTQVQRLCTKCLCNLPRGGQH